MIDIADLKPFFDDYTLDATINHDQLVKLNEVFVSDFINNPFKIDEKQIRIEQKPPKQKEFSAYSESFYHIITRTSNYYNDRIYECNRANRIHWIKPILLSHPCNDIKYYKWRDEQNICKEHYWYLSKNFMIVLKTITKDLKIVTAFCVDDDEKLKYYERFKNYQEGKSSC